MTMNADELCKEICVLLEPYNKAGITLDPKTDLTADLEIDSVAQMDLVMEIEDKFNIDIPINLLENVSSPHDLAKVVEKQLN